jgi:hypothetical protein
MYIINYFISKISELLEDIKRKNKIKRKKEKEKEKRRAW